MKAFRDRRSIAAVSLLFVFLLLLVALTSGKFQFLNQLTVISGGVAAALAALVLFALVLLWLVLWIIFPVFVYYGMKRQEKLLQQIERNTRITDQ